jgi:predicted cupin superfamily sugar epimerase
MTDDPQAPQTACRVYRGLEELPAEQVAARLNLQSHREGGFFRETYRSPFQVGTDAGPRPLSTVILYLLTSDDPSRFHRLRSDEMWYYHAGGPAEMVLLAPGGAQVAAVNLQVIGLDSPQLLVPAGHWLASRVIARAPLDCRPPHEPRVALDLGQLHGQPRIRVRRLRTGPERSTAEPVPPGKKDHQVPHVGPRGAR